MVNFANKSFFFATQCARNDVGKVIGTIVVLGMTYSAGLVRAKDAGADRQNRTVDQQLVCAGEHNGDEKWKTSLPFRRGWTPK
jgi:hypothetical protein